MTVQHILAAITDPPQLPGMLQVLGGASPSLTLLLAVHLVARLLIPVFLIVHTTRGAPATQRIVLVREYVLATTARRARR